MKRKKHVEVNIDDGAQDDPVRQLQRWYEATRRALPWRTTEDVYAIWISEVMLQQTRVETVLAYYQKFLDHFPNVDALARAERDEVCAAWSGLGYYNRARRLHRAAQQIVERGFPETAAAWQQLPGVGRYTAAAISSRVHRETIAAIDGNVERVMARWLGETEDPKRAGARRRIEEAATRLLDAKRPGDSNQALMELGATVCTPRRPSCEACPLRHGCRALREDPEAYPVKGSKQRAERLDWCVAVAEESGRFLLFRRPQGAGFLVGTWELPTAEWEGDRRRAETALAQRYGGRWKLCGEAGRVRHAITYRRVTLHVYRARVEFSGRVSEGEEAGWFERSELGGLPLSSMVGKALAANRSGVKRRTAEPGRRRGRTSRRSSR